MSSRYGPNLHSRSNTVNDPYERQRSEPPRYGYASTGAGYSRGGGGGYSPVSEVGIGGGGYRAATPNRKGQYSAAVMEELEAQNEEAVDGLSRKVRMLKDITVAIGTEVRDSTTLMGTINEGFEGTRDKLAGTMKGMLRMAQRGSGVGWRVWIAFFVAVVLLFWWVWV